MLTALLLGACFLFPARQEAASVEPREVLAQCEQAESEGRFDRARELVQQCWTVAQSLPVDEGTLAFFRSIATTAYRLGSLDTALDARRRILAEVEASHPPEDRELQRVRDELALVLRYRGDLQAAKELQELAHSVLARIAPDEDPDRLAIEQNLAATYQEMGDLPRALALQQRVLEIRLRTSDEADRNTVVARVNLAITLCDLGRLAEGRALLDEAHEVWSRTLPPEHDDLVVLRQNLASLYREMGDLGETRRLNELVLTARERTRPPDDPDLQAARVNLALDLRTLGELENARVLLEKAHDVYAVTLPEGHPTLQVVRSNLAITLDGLGELSAARELHEKVLDARLRTLVEDHRDIAVARMNLASNLWRSGDLRRAKVLFEQALASLERTEPETSGRRILAESNFAVVLHALGDHPGARAIQERVLAAREAYLPPEHADVLTARANLSATFLAMREWNAARELLEQVLEARERQFGAEDPRTEAVSANLAVVLAETGELGRARELLEEIHARRAGRPATEDMKQHSIAIDLAQVLRRMGDLTAARSIEEQCLAERERVLERSDPQLSSVRANLCLTLAGLQDWDALRSQLLELESDLSAVALAAGDLAARQAGELMAAMEHQLSILLSLAPRVAQGAELGERVFLVTERMRAVAASGDVRSQESEVAGLEAEVKELRSRVDELASARNETMLAETIVKRDRAESALRRSLAPSERTEVHLDVSALARSIEHGAVIAFRRYSGVDLDPLDGRAIEGDDRLLAHVLRHDGKLLRVELGAMAPIEAAVEKWRNGIGLGSGRGLGAPESSHLEADLHDAGGRVRALVLDPVLQAAGDARSVHVCPDDVLHLVPLEALPDGDSVIGDRVRIEYEVSLARLSSTQPVDEGAPSLFAMGGIAFSSSPALITHAEASLRRTTFDDLPGTRAEVRAIAELFEQRFDVKAEVLEGQNALTGEFRARTPSARFLHLATHGYFAEDGVLSWLDGELEHGAQRLLGVAPMTLCGIAMAGASDGIDSLGRIQGIVTAEEIAVMDLSSCELAVLSACDTNVGLRRAGQGVASLQKALHMAGARSVITSLWKVPDDATKELMIDFYRRLWIEEKPKSQALWEAKLMMREARDESGRPRHGVRDWAAWVLTGVPD